MIERLLTGGAVLCLLAFAAPLAAQEGEQEMSAETASMMEAMEEAGTPGAVHEALARTAGTWKATVKFWMGPEGEPEVMEATSTIEPIMGGRFVKETVESEWMGKPFHGVSIVGYNNLTGECEAVWYDNMSTALYRYSGSVNEAGDEVTLKGKYKEPGTGTWVETRSVRKIEGDRMVDTAWETRDGQEYKSMEIVYERQM